MSRDPRSLVRCGLPLGIALGAVLCVGCAGPDPEPKRETVRTITPPAATTKPTAPATPKTPATPEAAARAFVARMSGTWAGTFRGSLEPSLLGVTRGLNQEASAPPAVHFLIDVAPGEWEEHTWMWDRAKQRMSITISDNKNKTQTFSGVVQPGGLAMIGKAHPYAISFTFKGDKTLEWFTRGTSRAISVFRAERIDPAGPTAYGPVYFLRGSERLTQVGREGLDRTATALIKNKKGLLLISGHASTEEKKTREARHALGVRRAEATRDYLELRGVRAKQLLETYSLGDQRPACEGDALPCQVRNQRIEMLPF